jgi:hypothetical protein
MEAQRVLVAVVVAFVTFVRCQARTRVDTHQGEADFG